MIIGNLEVADENLPGTYTWDKAVEACSRLGDGWRLPTKDELNLLYKNKEAIGGFSEGFLWSSSQDSCNFAWVQRFSDGYQRAYAKYFAGGVRAVWALKKEGVGMTDHKHVVWVKRTDAKHCIECGGDLGVEVAEFPLDERGLLDWFAVAALEGWLSGSCQGNALDEYDHVTGRRPWVEHTQAVARVAYDYADAMLAERRARGKA